MMQCPPGTAFESTVTRSPNGGLPRGREANAQMVRSASALAAKSSPLFELSWESRCPRCSATKNISEGVL